MVALKKLPPPPMTVAEFLAWADVQPGRWQLRDGAPEMMAPPAERHSHIQNELARLIVNHLFAIDSPCRCASFPGVIPDARSARTMLVPDIGVTCAPPASGHAMRDPVLLIEILSRFNAAASRANAREYLTIPSVMEVMIVTSNRIAAEVMRRQPDGLWPERPDMIRAGGTLRLASIGLDVLADAAYRTTDLAR
jgi:Uma2 family endonuclease